MTDDSVLADYRRWLLKMATIIAPDRPDAWQDLAQEGHIAMWKALRTFDESKGALPSWLTGAAKLRMRDVYRRDTWLGTISEKGHRREKPARPIDTGEDWVSELLGAQADALESVEWQYHEGEIYAAINALSPVQREYVYRRFWKGETPTEIDKDLVAARYHWSKAKAALAATLGYLVGV
jgi:RNA polymerase sigma factor (sigma-70 family)